MAAGMRPPLFLTVPHAPEALATSVTFKAALETEDPVVVMSSGDDLSLWRGLVGSAQCC